MNIFAIDENPILAAMGLCDSHVVKMCLETTQLLSTHSQIINGRNPSLYRPTHHNHPCRRWLNEDQSNINWLIIHGNALFMEYAHRYRRDHKSEEVFHRAAMSTYSDNLDHRGKNHTPFALAMPDEFVEDDRVQSYRNYYIHKSQTLERFTYTKRTPPAFLITAGVEV